MTRMNVHAGLATSIVAALALNLAGCATQSPLVKLPASDTLPTPTGSYLDLGRALLQQSRIDLAYDAFIRSIRIEGTTAAAFTGAGIAAERQGLLSEARSFFEKARAQAPNSVLAHNNLGAVHFRLGEYHAARRAFQAAFALSSGKNEIAARNLNVAELAIEREGENGANLARNPIQLQRMGSGAYKLEPDRSAGQG